MTEPRKDVGYYDSGQKHYEEYHIGSLPLPHRTDGPARIMWYEIGQKRYEKYYIEGQLHRTDGPAIIEWSVNGQKWHEEYYGS